jgi:hypothetical protein
MPKAKAERDATRTRFIVSSPKYSNDVGRDALVVIGEVGAVHDQAAGFDFFSESMHNRHALLHGPRDDTWTDARAVQRVHERQQCIRSRCGDLLEHYVDARLRADIENPRCYA